MSSTDVPRSRGIPEVTEAMKRAGVEALQSSPADLPPEELVTRVYEAMAREIAMMPVFSSAKA